MPILKGNRPRPRVALVGNFEEEVIVSLRTLFSTLWMEESFSRLLMDVSPKELDLIIIGHEINLFTYDQNAQNFLNNAHVICFSSGFEGLPGPSGNTWIQVRTTSSTEEYVIPELPLRKFNLLEADLSSIDNAKGWAMLDLVVQYRHSTAIPDAKQKDVLFDGALIYDFHTKLPFATIFNRLSTGLGVAWLPNNNFRIVPWVELICSEWALLDPVRFPDFGDWTKDPNWTTQKEDELKLTKDNLINELKGITLDYKKRISDVDNELVNISLLVNRGKRRLITSQGHELLDEVAQSFKELGYDVTIIDDELPANLPKKEDLRIRDPDVEDWEAIIEVRGHTKSSGQPSDLIRLSKFARLYYAETGREPNKLIYIVNGQIEFSSPRQRQEPFSSASVEVQAFGEQDGLIIWTLDLFKLLKSIQTEEDKVKARKSIRESVGRFLLEL